jgi:hypothetical protein
MYLSFILFTIFVFLKCSYGYYRVFETIYTNPYTTTDKELGKFTVLDNELDEF